MVNDVFKFPDGKGGFILKIQGPDAQWHVCDENGNYEKEEDTPLVVTSRDDDRGSKQTGRRSARKEKDYADNSFRFCIRASEKDGVLINDYVAWKSFHEHRNISRSDFMLKAALSVIKRDSEFNAFLKSQK